MITLSHDDDYKIETNSEIFWCSYLLPSSVMLIILIYTKSHTVTQTHKHAYVLVTRISCDIKIIKHEYIHNKHIYSSSPSVYIAFSFSLSKFYL